MTASPHTGRAAGSVLTVSQLNQAARRLLENGLPRVTVEGEISNFVTPASGHWYMVLKDSAGQLRCAMFSSANRRARFRPRNGDKVTVYGRITIYSPRGNYQLIADSMEEAGAGAIQRAFEELKAKLQAEGLFDASRKKDVHNRYRHVAVVTSRTGAVIRDIISVFGRRFPATRLTLFPATVQGRGAADDVVRAIEMANRHREKLGLEALIVARGGGSLEDLQGFNEEKVARAISGSALPVVSAVGHETDYTIADFAADQRAPTPSAAAEMMSLDQEDCLAQLADDRQRLGQCVQQLIEDGRRHLELLARPLKRPDRRLQEHAQSLDQLEARMRRALRNSLQAGRERSRRLRRALEMASPQNRIRRNLERLDAGGARLRRAMALLLNTADGRARQSRRAVLAASPRDRIVRDLERLDAAAARLARAVGRGLAARRDAAAALERGLAAVGPENVLKRGYSITLDAAGRVVRDADDARPGDRIESRLAGASILSVVDAVSKRSPDA